ncbi:7943_t:CDS:2, partial [Cetraspora pellucida]
IFQEIEYRFQIKGHTRNSVDRGFGLTKREYTRSEVWCIDQLLDVIDRSANNNIPINLEDQIGPFRDWTSALSTLYRRPPAIQKYHIFQFSHERPGIMRAKVRIDDPWDEFQLLKRNVNVIALNPQELQPKGLPEEKQVELWEKIRPYCPVAFRDELCPKPQNDLFERAGDVEHKTLPAAEATETETSGIASNSSLPGETSKRGRSASASKLDRSKSKKKK